MVVLSREALAPDRFDAAHELAHLVLHPDEEPGSHAVERQADAFAAAFLAPADEIRSVLPARIDWSRLLELKTTWGISMQALLYRARTLGVMNEYTYRRAMTQVGARGWRLNEPGDRAPAERQILLTKALDLVAARGIDLATVAEELHLNPETVELIVGIDDRPIVSL